MNLLDCQEYKEDVAYVAALSLPWEKLKNKSIMISGGTGLIGSFLIDTIMYHNNKKNLNCMIYVLGRNHEKALERFQVYFDSKNFSFIQHDINQPIGVFPVPKVNYIIHLASNTHPVAYATDPIGTITTNMWGLKHMLDFAVTHQADRVAFASSNEIYGENRGDVELFNETYCGYINCNTMRAGYPESKRCGEALCQAYIKQESLDVVIPRLTRSYGATLLKSDSKAMSQFISKAISGEDIVLKSTGNQYYSYTYVADAVSGFLTTLLLGESGKAYNIADVSGDITLKELAEIIAEKCGRKVVFELPDEIESKGYSVATKARLDGTLIQELGWNAKYSISEGVERTIDILLQISKSQKS